jgi:acyl-coenzyme A thioesterase 13
MFENFIGKSAQETNSPSPWGKLLNGTLLAAEIGKMRVSLEVRPEFTNPGGILHGGAIAGFIDEVIGFTTFSLKKNGFYVAMNLNVDFLRPGVLGETIIAETEVIKDGKNVAHIICNVYNQAGKLIAKASSNLMLTQISK